MEPLTEYINRKSIPSGTPQVPDTFCCFRTKSKELFITTCCYKPRSVVTCSSCNNNSYFIEIFTINNEKSIQGVGLNLVSHVHDTTQQESLENIFLKSSGTQVHPITIKNNREFEKIVFEEAFPSVNFDRYTNFILSNFAKSRIDSKNFSNINQYVLILAGLQYHKHYLLKS